MRVIWQFLTIGLSVGPLMAQGALSSGSVPRELRGKWKVIKELDTRTISCWGEEDAKRVLGTTIEYSSDQINWRGLRTKALGAEIKTITAEQFHDQNSGGGANDSQIDFGQLGINQSKAVQIAIHHADAEITGATTEFPGDRVLMKRATVIIFSVCNLYFEARRVNLR